MLKKRIFISLAALSCSVFCFEQCSKSSSGSGSGTGGGGTTPPTATNDVEYWLTKADQSVLLTKQSTTISFTGTANSNPNIEVDSSTAYQSVDGFGYTLTGSSAQLINQLPSANRTALLNELFGNGSSSIGVSYLRVSLGASDLSPAVFSYDDMPAGSTDPTLANFSLSKDTVDLIPLLKDILAINPSIKILASPWSAPLWMKDNSNSVNGTLLPAYYSAYSKYFVKYIQQMQAKGITINAVTIQNEPQNGGNNPSMVLSAAQEASFIKNNLGPDFAAAGITTKIIVWDHNCDMPSYPTAILADAAAKAYVDGSAFHLYAGDISAMGTVHNAYPDKNVYFTEQYTSAGGSFDGDLKWHIKNVIIGSMLNWSKNALEWNLANDIAYGPHTAGGCTDCKGAITINASAVNRNVAYYNIAHASKFVPAGSVRIASTVSATFPNVVFKTPAGKKVMIVLNENPTTTFNISYKGKYAPVTIPTGVATLIW